MKNEPVESIYNSYIITDLDKEKKYMVISDKKAVVIEKAVSIDKGLQYLVFNSINPKGGNIKRELSYIKDETIKGKDCIFVKEVTYSKKDDDSFQPDIEFNEDIRAYWIEKSTGFVLGSVMIKPTQTKATPYAWINNITFNVVVDSDFDLPTGYQIRDNTK